MDPNLPSGASSPAVPVPPLPAHGTFFPRSPRLSSNSSSTHSRRSLKSLARIIADHRDHRDPRKLLSLVHKLHEQLGFEKDRADRAELQSSEALLYLKSTCEEKLRALRDIARLEEELKLYKVQYDEAQKEIFRAQKILHEVDEKRYRAEKLAADARSALRRTKDEISVLKAQDEGRREGMLEGFRKGRELGIQEGMKLAQDEVVRIVTTPPPPTVVPQVQQPGLSRVPSLSRAPSLTASRPPTAPPKSPTRSLIAQEADITSPPVQSTVAGPDEPRNHSFRLPSPPTQMLSAAVIPDNFIPLLDEDNRIRLPPAFEFHRPTSPVPPPRDQEEIRIIPPPASSHARSARSHRSASPASASSTFSHMEMLTIPRQNGGGTPMSVIPESLSQENSPQPHDAATLQRQPSLAAQSVKSMASELRDPIYTRPRSISGGSSVSGLPPPVIPGLDSPAGVSIEGTALGIATQPPLDPDSNDAYNNEVSDSIFIPPLAETRSPNAMQHHLDANSPMIIHHNQFSGGWDQGLENISSDSMNPPVIPHPDLFTDIGDDDDDDAVSSGMESMESLTTPPARQQKLPSRAGSARSVGDGSALSHRTGPVAASYIGSVAGPSRSRAGSVMSAGGSALATSNVVPRAASMRSAGGSALSHRTEPLAASHTGSRVGGSRAGSIVGSAAGPSGSAIGTVPDSQWGDLVNSAQSPNPDAAYTPQTRSQKGGSVLSVKTTGSRSGR